MAYATEAANGFHTRFDLDAPDVLPNLGPFSALLHFPGAGEIVGGYVYVVDTANTLYQLDPDTGVVLSSGSITAPPNGETYAGMALDPTSGLVYASSTNLDTASLFIVDLNTGTATRIGPITGAACNIALAIDGSGQVYGYDVCTDDFWSIDKSTGAGTLIGSIGFDANYAQGMGWDPVSDQIYLAAFNNVSFQGELRLADRATGNTTLLGVLGSSDPGGTCHLPWLGIPGAAGVDVPWVSEEPASGAIPAGSDLDVSVILSAAPPYDALGDYSAGLTLWHNDPAVGAVTIPLTMTVLACLPIQRALLSWAPPMPLISETVTFYAQAIGGAPPYTFSWDLGDGYTGAGAIVTHTYTALGQYRVAMTATSACNAVVVERTLVVPSFVWEIYLPLLARGYSPGTATVPGWFWPRSIGGKL
jgi:hypothetical protein